MNNFAKLPLKIRLSVVIVFLIASVVVGILGHPSRMLLIAAALLFVSGAWRISKTRSFVLVLIVVPALAGLLLTHFDWHHPFLVRYSAGLFSVVAALLLMDGLRIEEWIEILRGRRGKISFSAAGPLLIGTAVGTISLAANIQEQRTCRRLARISSWRAKSRASIFLDGIALPFYNAVESHEVIDEALHRWSPREADRATGMASPVELRFGNSNFTARLADLNDFPRFPEVRAAVLSTVPVPAAWKTAVSRLEKPARILEIGDHAGQFTKYLAENGFDVLLEAALEDASASPWDHIFLHHNTFLEAINRTGLPAVLSRLHALSRQDGHVFFDYPVKVMPMSQAAIVSCEINAIGKVDYRYSRHQQDGDLHKVWLEYTVRQEHESFCVLGPLSFVAPELAVILAAARGAGFSCSTSPMPDAPSLLGGELLLIELQKSD